MNNQDAFAGILASVYDAMLDDAQWPATSALIDEACGLTGNALLVGEGPKDDIRALFVGFYRRAFGQTLLQDLDQVTVLLLEEVEETEIRMEAQESARLGQPVRNAD